MLYKKLKFAKKIYTSHIWPMFGTKYCNKKYWRNWTTLFPFCAPFPLLSPQARGCRGHSSFGGKLLTFFACWHEREQSRNQNDSLLLKIDIFHIVLHYIDMSTKRSQDLLQFQKHVYIFECSFFVFGFFRLFLDYNLTWPQLSGQKGILPNQKCVVSTELVLAEVAINCTNWCVLLVCP